MPYLARMAIHAEVECSEVLVCQQDQSEMHWSKCVNVVSTLAGRECLSGLY